MSDTVPPPDPTALPNYDFSNGGSLAGVLRQHKKSIMQDMEHMLPAHVVEYDPVANVAVVQPAIHMVTSDGTLVGRAQLASVPVFAFGGGGFVARFPLAAGNSGWIKSCDRDISNYLAKGTATGPNSARMHSFADGVFYPDVVNGFTLMSGGETAFTLQSMDGATGIALSMNIELLATNGTITLSASNHTILINAAGVFIDGVEFAPHTHSGGTLGSGTTGPVNG